jgi:hypothetical protein
MAHVPSLRWWQHALALVLLGLPVTAAAQISPTTPAHPNLPWGIGVATPQGQLIRYIYVPPQPVTLQYLVPGAPESAPPGAEPPPPGAEPPPPGAEPPPPAAGPPPGAAGDAKPPADAAAPESVPATPQIVQQQVTVPGYYVRETTVGFHYPDRWTIEQVGPNAYRWRPLPAQFVPK